MNSVSVSKPKVLRLRLKDKHATVLDTLAHEVNFVWNYCNELQITMFNRERRFLSGYDFAKFTRGATKEGLHLHSQTVQAIAEEFARRRRQFSRRSLGWRPFKREAIQVRHGQIKFAGRWLSLWDSYGLDAYQIRAGSICEDARGRWYLNACIAAPVAEPTERSSPRCEVGIDLGLKDLVTTSTGRKCRPRNSIVVSRPSSPSRIAPARRTMRGPFMPKLRTVGRISYKSSRLAQ